MALSLSRCAVQVLRPAGRVPSLSAPSLLSVSVPPVARRAVQSLGQPAPATAAAMFIAEERGAANSPDYRVYIKDSGGPIAAMHDVPLWADRGARIANMVVEVPRWSNAKLELALAEPLTPLRQDTKRGALRYVSNVFPHRGYIWNYGALPQTWENPSHVDPGTQARGDNDPVDVIEIGSRVAKSGDVIGVKILGALAMLDEGETDWKLLAIDTRDALAGELNGPADVEAKCPGLLRATVEWFRLYKVPDGKPPNTFAYDSQFQDAEFAHRIIDETHEFWRGLMGGKLSSGDIDKTCVTGEWATAAERSAAAKVLADAAPRALPLPPPPHVDKVHYLSNL